MPAPIQSVEHFLNHFANIKAQHRRYNVIPQAALQPTSQVSETSISQATKDFLATLTSSPILVTIDVTESDDHTQTVLNLTYSDNSTKIITIPDLTHRVEALEANVSSQSSNLTSLVQSQVDAANAVLNQFNAVNNRVAKIEQVV
jgi:hypothetical protein